MTFSANLGFLFKRGFTPLSAIKDMIGSRATRGKYVLALRAQHRALRRVDRQPALACH